MVWGVQSCPFRAVVFFCAPTSVSSGAVGLSVPSPLPRTSVHNSVKLQGSTARTHLEVRSTGLLHANPYKILWFLSSSFLARPRTSAEVLWNLIALLQLPSPPARYNKDDGTNDNNQSWESASVVNLTSVNRLVPKQLECNLHPVKGGLKRPSIWRLCLNGLRFALQSMHNKQ